jgi:UPF0755 protein
MLDELELAFEEEDGRGRRRRGQRQPERRREGRAGRSLVALGLSLIILAVLGLGGWYSFTKLQGFLSAPDYSSPGSGEAVVEVLPDQTAADIAQTLYAKGVVKSPKAFVDAARDDPRSKEIQPGTYKLQQKMPAADALTLMLDPKSRLVKTVTIPEGTISVKIFDLLSEKTGIPVADFKAAAADPAALGVPESWFKRSDGKAPIRGVEGFLFPATYEFEPNVTAAQMLQKMVSKFLEVAESLKLEQLAQAKSMTPFEILITASLVQAEAGIDADMPKVSRVVYNRLNHKPDVMALEFDSTTNYWLSLKGQARKPSQHLTEAELDDPNNPYNTKSKLGLPPGPIGCPGEVALRAALNPEAGPWLFFVVIDKTGKSAFAVTATEHDKNIELAKKNGVF